MHWYAGTSGYSYAAWKGSFYPEDLTAEAMLGYYATRLPAVEINNTFYRMPRSNVLENWAAAVPDGFRFVIKASRRITHLQRLKAVEEPAGYLLDRVALLGDRLGAVLFQLPPNLPRDRDRLAAFLDLLNDRVPAAFEFRHPSWFEPDIIELLRAAGAALCIAEDDAGQGSEGPELTATAPWLYLRLRRASYRDADLRRWLKAAHASGVERGFAFFKHEDAGAGPIMAERFLKLAGAAGSQGATAPAGKSARRARPPQRSPGRGGSQRTGSGTRPRVTKS